MVQASETILVTGFLGTGKTTLLRGWLAQRPPGERWAVLVNEFGALGVDRALLGGDAGGRDAEAAGRDADPGEVAVVEVAGGCACCAAQVAFGATLVRLLRRGPWHRLFIETTGLGHPARLVDQLRAPGLAGRLWLRPPVAVVDATRAGLYFDPGHPGHALAADQLALARAVVLNRIGDLPPDTARDLAERLAAVPPWRRPVLPTADGTVDLRRVLAALAGAGSATDPPAAPVGPGPLIDPSPPSGARLAPNASSTSGQASISVTPAPRATLPEPMRWQRADAAAAAAGWWWPADAVFDRAALAAALDALVAPGAPLQVRGLLRGKAVFRTARAWYAWQWVDGRSDWQETAWRADNRLEILAERAIDPQVVDVALRAAAAKG